MSIPRIVSSNFEVYPQKWDDGEWTLEVDCVEYVGSISITYEKLKSFLNYIEDQMGVKS